MSETRMNYEWISSALRRAADENQRRIGPSMLSAAELRATADLRRRRRTDIVIGLAITLLALLALLALVTKA